MLIVYLSPACSRNADAVGVNGVSQIDNGGLLMKTRSISAAMLIAAALGGCATPYSEAPLATNFPTSKQPKLQAAAHWNLIANDVASQLMASLKSKSALPPLYVDQGANKTEFDRAFSNQMISRLVAEGFVVQKNPAGALIVNVDTQAIQFSASRPQYSHAGTATLLTGAVWALHQASPAGIATAAVVGADAYMWFRAEFATGATPQTEIIVTASVSDSRQYIARTTSVYYVADTDASLYRAPAPATTLKVIGG